MDCTTQNKGRIVGCTRKRCHFEHVRGKRDLSADEKGLLKRRIEDRNKLIAADIAGGATDKFMLEGIAAVLD